MTSKEAFELIFGKYGINDAGFKIWEAAVNWERHELIDLARRQKSRHDNAMKKMALDTYIDAVKKRIKKDRDNQSKGEGNV